MIQIDLTNDAPMIETVDEDGFIHITTATNATTDDKVIYHGVEDEWTKADVLSHQASARSTQRFGGKTIEYSVRERDLKEFGHYVVHGWTRRGQERVFHLQFVKVAGDEAKVALIVDPRSTVCSWVTSDDVFPGSSKEKLVLELALR